MTSTSTTAKRRFSFRRKAASPLADGHHKKTFWQRVYRDRYLLLLFLPCLIYYILFKYVPMWGVLISFKDFKPFIGFMGSDWVGLKHYVNFFSNPDAWRIIRNTLFLGVYSLVWCFPFPIIFALALNEVTRTRFKKFVQTISYMPHFLSAVVVCGMLVSFLSPIRGIINTIITMFGGEAINFLSSPAWFRTIYVASEVWQTLGWGAIVYLAAISNVDPQYYEAAKLDGASRLRQIWSITLPWHRPHCGDDADPARGLHSGSRPRKGAAPVFSRHLRDLRHHRYLCLPAGHGIRQYELRIGHRPVQFDHQPRPACHCELFLQKVQRHRAFLMLKEGF